MLDRLKSIWAAIRGDLSWQEHCNMFTAITNLNRRQREAEETMMYQYRELEFARTGIADLKDQLCRGDEAPRGFNNTAVDPAQLKAPPQ